MILISGCGEEPSPSNTRTEPPPDELRIPFNGVVKSIDPGWIISEANQVELIEQLFLGLTTLEKSTYKVVPRLARKWETNEDGTVYTFSLRQDVKWSDDKPVTAHDVVWTIQRNFKISGGMNAAFGMLKNAQLNQEKLEKDKQADISSLGVRAFDEHTVQFTLEDQLPFFPALVSYAPYRPLPSWVIEKHGDQWAKPANIQSNGPYMLTEWKADKLTLAKNPKYYDANKVKISKVHYHIVSRSLTGLAMYEKNQLDIIGGTNYLRLPQTELPRIKSDMILSKDLKGGFEACTEWYGFNTQRYPTNDLQVRKAIAAAIDKQLLIDVVLKSNHTLAKTFTPPLMLGWKIKPEKRCPSSEEEGLFGIPFCPEKARKELEQAHKEKVKKANVHQDKKIVLLHNINETHSATAKGIQTLLKHYLGIDIEVEVLDYDSYQKQITVYSTVPIQKRPHIFRASWCGSYPEAYLWVDAFNPEYGWYKWLLDGNEHQKEFSEIVGKIPLTSNKTERVLLYRRAEEILTNKAVVMMPFFFENAPVLVKPRVKGWYHMAYGGQHIYDWSLEKQKKE
jgi:ABC-type oligopeptide transport system substrate-binding subunit